MIEVPNEITENLYPGERVLSCIKKKIKLELKPKYLAVTDRRVMYLDQKILGRYDLKDIPYEKMEEVYFKQGAVGSEFQLKNEGGELIKLSWLDREECQGAIVAIRDAINAISVEQVSINKKKRLFGREEWSLKKPKETVMRTLPMTKVVETSKPSTREDPMEKLKKLKELYDMGVISEEEYQEKRGKLMKLI